MEINMDKSLKWLGFKLVTSDDPAIQRVNDTVSLNRRAADLQTARLLRTTAIALTILGVIALIGFLIATHGAPLIPLAAMMKGPLSSILHHVGNAASAVMSNEDVKDAFVVAASIAAGGLMIACGLYIYNKKKDHDKQMKEEKAHSNPHPKQSNYFEWMKRWLEQNIVSLHGRLLWPIV